jgi:putative transcriptional regulator
MNDMETSKIAPGFLVAAPQLRDPHFENTVILMIEHEDAEGSLGLVINRPASIDLDIVLSEMQITTKGTIDIAAQPPLLYGGPVQPDRGWVVHSPDWSGPETVAISEGVSVTASRDVLEDLVAGQGPARYRFCLGYSGWGPQQLVGEIKTGAWIPVPLSSDLIFETTLDDIWASSLARLGINPANLVSVTGDA